MAGDWNHHDFSGASDNARILGVLLVLVLMLWAQQLLILGRAREMWAFAAPSSSIAPGPKASAPHDWEILYTREKWDWKTLAAALEARSAHAGRVLVVINQGANGPQELVRACPESAQTLSEEVAAGRIVPPLIASEGSNEQPVKNARAEQPVLFVRRFSGNSPLVRSPEMIGDSGAQPAFRVQNTSVGSVGKPWGVYSLSRVQGLREGNAVGVFGGVELDGSASAGAWGMNAEVDRQQGASGNANVFEASLRNFSPSGGPHGGPLTVGILSSSFGDRQGDVAFWGTTAGNMASRWKEGLHLQDFSDVGIHLSSPVSVKLSNPLPAIGIHMDPRDRATSWKQFGSPSLRLSVSVWDGAEPSLRHVDAEAVPAPPSAYAWRLKFGGSEKFRVDSEGNVIAFGTLRAESGGVLAEPAASLEALEPGDVVEIDPDRPGYVRKSLNSFGPALVGVITDTPAIVVGNSTAGSGGNMGGRQPLMAFSGQTLVKVTDEGGPIQAGDLLTSSSTAGHAMRCPNAQACAGLTIAKAMSAHEAGRGVIRAFLMLR